jgi:hypothetical protein
MGWIFAFTILAELGNIALSTQHPRPHTLLQKVLIGPMFSVQMAAICGVALWAIWRDKSWARDWAAAASSIYLLYFLRQFIIPVRPVWDHHVSMLLVGILGVVVFSWPDKQVDVSRSD